MATNLSSNSPGAVFIDGSVAIAICAREAFAEPLALAELGRYSRLGYDFFAPGVLVSESLYVLCGKLNSGALTLHEHVQAVVDLENFVSGILPPPNGESALIQRAEAIRGGYSCRRSADGIYIALAEQLTQTRSAILLTFDKELPK